MRYCALDAFNDYFVRLVGISVLRCNHIKISCDRMSIFLSELTSKSSYSCTAVQNSCSSSTEFSKSFTFILLRVNAAGFMN